MSIIVNVSNGKRKLPYQEVYDIYDNLYNGGDSWVIISLRYVLYWGFYY